MYNLLTLCLYCSLVGIALLLPWLLVTWSIHRQCFINSPPLFGWTKICQTLLPAPHMPSSSYHTFFSPLLSLYFWVPRVLPALPVPSSKSLLTTTFLHQKIFAWYISKKTSGFFTAILYRQLSLKAYKQNLQLACSLPIHEILANKNFWKMCDAAHLALNVTLFPLLQSLPGSSSTTPAEENADAYCMKQLLPFGLCRWRPWSYNWSHFYFQVPQRPLHTYVTQANPREDAQRRCSKLTYKEQGRGQKLTRKVCEMTQGHRGGIS